jgi:dTMP kinase
MASNSADQAPLKSTTAGCFIAIEGTDGSGKATHTKALTGWLKQLGYSVTTVDFPRYGQPSSYFVKQYLAGQYGSLEDVGPYRGSLFYALDRYEASFQIRQALENGHIVISDRYVGSNMGHQGSKITSSAERHQYFTWNTNLEYTILNLPKPTLNLVLHMPAEHAAKLVRQRHAPGHNLDLHEASPHHLGQAEQTYLELCQLFPDLFTRISCVKDHQIRSIEDIQTELRQLITPHLPSRII